MSFYQRLLASLIIGHHSGSIQEMMRAYGKYHPCKSSVVRANERVVVGGLSKQRFLFLIEWWIARLMLLYWPADFRWGNHDETTQTLGAKYIKWNTRQKKNVEKSKIKEEEEEEKICSLVISEGNAIDWWLA